MEKTTAENKSAMEIVGALFGPNSPPGDFTEDAVPIKDRLCPTPLAT